MYKNIYLDAPSVGALEKDYLNKAISAGYVSTAGGYVSEFEKKIAEYLKVEKAVSTQSGTAALHISLLELGIGRGDEVIVPALTFVATVNPIMYVGARPVFVDIDRQTWNIDSKKIEAAITYRTKAIIPVHLYGNPCNMDKIEKIAQKHKLYVIEDATESLGAKYKGRYTGTFGDFGCFSFNGNKIITTGGGGMVVGKSFEKIDHIKFLINQAKSLDNSAYHSEVGFNYRMTNIEAALGLAQIRRLKYFLAKKRKFKNIYEEELRPIAGICFQREEMRAESSFWLTCVIVDNRSAGFLQSKLLEQGIPARRIFMPLMEFPFCQRGNRGDFSNSYYLYERGLCLPSSTLNKENDIFNVCKVIKNAIK
ncbi:MAG: aminotransferase class I/II-fold pyridoxal phosphate-dependent enzyme [Candidatus Omnitrophota bacterium]|nr:DegT/DnrJ/EryC1/StrS family aminotransferase [Candidatus Omnitrophota bacterium]